MAQKVRDVIKHKLEQEQVQECNLTFKDLDIIAQAFIKVLAGMQHQRIVYPEEVAKEMGGYENVTLLDDSESAKTADSTAKTAIPTPTSSSDDDAKNRPPGDF
jgi:hypothetical protein